MSGGAHRGGLQRHDEDEAAVGRVAPRAPGGELLSVGETQASAGSGDNGDFALQRHGAPLLLEALSAVAECA